MCLPISVK